MAAVAAVLAGVVGVAAGAAHAEPVAAPEPESIRYSMKLVHSTVVTTLRDGRFELFKAVRGAVDDPNAKVTERDGKLVAADGRVLVADEVVDVVDLRDAQGHSALLLPLDIRFGAVRVPVRGVLAENGTALELTPSAPAGLDRTQPVAAKAIASESENQLALNEFSSLFALSTSIGTFLGTAIGATVGCVATIAAGCVTGLVTGASVGGIIGTIALGGPTLVASGIDLLTTLNAPDGTTRFAEKPKTVQPQTPPN